MSSQYFQRNSGFPLLLKIAALLAALFVAYLLLKIFAFVLTGLFALMKVVALVALIVLAASFLLKVLFGIHIFPFGTRHPSRYFRR